MNIEKLKTIDDSLFKIDSKIENLKSDYKSKIHILNEKRKKLISEKDSQILKMMDGIDRDEIINMLQNMKS